MVELQIKVFLASRFVIVGVVLARLLAGEKKIYIIIPTKYWTK